MDLKMVLLILSLQLALGLDFPVNGGSRRMTSVVRRPPPYRSVFSGSRVEIPAGEYEESYAPNEDLDLDYYDKYEPYRYGSQSLIPFYRPRSIYYDKPLRQVPDRSSLYDEPLPQDSLRDYADGMYDDTTWYDDPENGEANRAFIKNLLMAQLYQDSKYPSYGSRYDFENEDNNGRKYDYGIPTTKIGETEQVRRFFDENIDSDDNDDVRALEALAGKEMKEKEIDEKEVKGKEPTKKPEGSNEMTEKSVRAKPKLTDLQEYFNLQKQLLLNGRKSNARPVAEGFRVDKKQIYEPGMGKVFDFEPSDESTTNSIKKLNVIKENIMMKDMPPTSTSAAAAVLTTTAAPQKLANGGQKEVVLPRPSNPARKPYPEVATRSMNPPSVYDTIKKLLDMERGASTDHKTRAQPQKRFAVVTDDPLTAELSQLKKPSA